MSRPLCLISVSDKSGLEDLGRALVAAGYDILSTGGTARALAKAGIRYLSVSDFTGFPEIFDGRVKTLHPRIHGGLLGRRGYDDAAAAAAGIRWIDLLVVNLYPFAKTLESGASFADCVEQIDIGGPAMIRAAAKNHAHVTVCVDPSDYPALIDAIARDDRSPALRRALATRAFRHVAAHDDRIASWLEAQDAPPSALHALPADALAPLPEAPPGAARFPDHFTLHLKKIQDLRYGENPHQQSAFYADPDQDLEARDGKGRSLARATQLQGKELSFNNLADLDAALRCVFEFVLPAAVVVKHNNPCGAATHPDPAEAFRLALSGDPVSAYGGILTLNKPLSAETARAILDSKVFFEVIAAPAIPPEVAALFQPRRNLRLLSLPADWAGSQPPGADCRRVQGGWLFQDWDINQTSEWKELVRPPTPDEAAALRFAWAVCRNVKSNAITLARTEGEGIVLNGVGAGQMSRVDSVRLAIQKATRPVAGSVLASDAFFPFADGVQLAVDAGISAIVQPGGSIRDAEVIHVAAQKGVSMIMTDIRHFRH